MSRIARKTATATVVVRGKSDTVDSLPLPSPPYHDGDQPTIEYQDNYTDDELATILENTLTEVITRLFPRPCGRAHAELVSVAVVIT